ncbi:MAG: hypothetical protein C0597_11740 [Marinilabiliales bacterium]|nr:MAG: hypothetical protein C0597_11740 [Marinilabiliales bacterium]
MNYEQIKKRIAPCGMYCGKCFSFNTGDIGEYASKLQKALGEFDIYAKRFSELIDEPKFLKYPEFKEMLNYFATPQCKGCREEKCKLFKDCKVRGCTEKMNVDFCFECRDFQCNDTGFDEHLQKRYVRINERMQEIGVEKYYEEIKDKPRYQ